MIAPMPGTSRPWMQALDAQLVALRQVRMLENVVGITNDHMWKIDAEILEHAAPFSWSDETVAAVMSAMRSVPLDTRLNEWNLNTPAAWWYFDEPLPFRTITAEVGIRAMSLGWIQIPRERIVYPAGTPTWMVDAALKYGPYDRGLAFSAWVDDPEHQFTVMASQTMMWDYGQTLEEHLASCRKRHIASYGPGSPNENVAQVGLETFMAAAEAMARFMLAGLAWLEQRVVVESDGPIERHRRKDFNRQTGQNLMAVKVVHLRRMKRAEQTLQNESTEATPKKRELTCRFTVDGHWRNQACGPKRGDRKLTWIHPFLKGPENAPLRVPQHKVYVVNR